MEVEAFPIRFTRGIRSYCRRRKYQRLESAGGGGGGKVSGGTQHLGARRGGWGVRLRRLLRLRVRVVPGRVLRRIRDAYVGGMLAVARKASAVALPGGPEGLWTRRVPRRKQLPAARPDQPSEFEQRLIFEIYKSIVASKELTTMLHSSTARTPVAAI